MSNEALQGYLNRFVTRERQERFAEVLAWRTKYITVALEDVFQMHNSSAVIRSCEVFGIQEAHLVEARFGKRLDKNIAMGAQQWVDTYSYSSSKACIESLRERGFKIVATTPHTDAGLLENFRIDSPLALFFGTEKEGLSDSVLREADVKLKIPMVGFTESLNISVSAAIILQSLSSQLRKSKLPWELTEEEKSDIQLSWTKKSIKSIDEIMSRYHNNS